MPGPYIPKPTIPIPPTSLGGPACSVPFVERDGTPRNLLNRAASTVTGSLGWSGGLWGTCRDISPLGGSNYEAFTFAPAINYGSGPWTAEIWATFRQFQATSPKISALVFLSDGAQPTTNRAIMRVGNSTLANNQPNWVGPGGVSLGIGPARLTVGLPYQLAMTYDGATLRGYVNGTLDSSIACAAQAGALVGTVMLWRDDSGALARGPDCQGHAFNLWGRALTAPEVAERYRDLGGLWRGRRSRTAIAAALGASSGPPLGPIATYLRRRRGNG